MMKSGIYLVVQFSFPKPFQAEYGAKAKALHQALEGQDWVEGVFAASGGIGAGPSSMWVFKLSDFSALDRLFGGEDPVSEAYVDFFTAMDDVQDFVREEVIFA
jgi:hypothetical protein